MSFPGSGMVRFSAQSESAFLKNFNPNHPPPFQTNLQFDPNLTQLYGYLAGAIAQEIELRRKESPPRMYLFNKMGVNGFSNQDFTDLFEIAIRYSLVLYYVKRESSNWHQIVDKAAKDAINMVVAALILTNPDLQSQYKPAAHEMAHLNNIFNYMQQVEQDAQMVINSIQNQNTQNPTMMMNTGMMMPNSGMMGGGMNPSEPTVNVPGYGTVPLSMYNRMTQNQPQQNRPMMGGMGNPQGFGAPTGYNPVSTGFNPNAVGTTFQAPGMGISPNAARQLVQAPQIPQFTGGGSHVSGVQNVGHQYGIGMGEDDDWHEGGTEFSGGIEMSPPVTQKPAEAFIPQFSQASPSALTSIVNGKELHEGKSVYRVQDDPEHFYVEYDGSKLFKPSAACPAVPAANIRKNKPMYRINNQTGEFTVILVDLTDQEKMDIAKHLILIEDEDQRERMRALMLASKAEPIEIRPARGRITVQGSVDDPASGTEGEAVEGQEPEPIVPVEVPEYGHAINTQELCAEGIEAKHLTNKIAIVSQGDMPAAVTTLGNDYEIILDRTGEGVVSEFIDKANNTKTFMRLAKLLKDSFEEASNMKVPNWSLMNLIKKIDTKMTQAINLRLQCQLGVDVSVNDFYASYNDLMAGMESHYGVVITEALQKDEESFIKSVVAQANEELESFIATRFDETDIGKDAYSVGSFGVLVQPRSITDIEATSVELNIKFGDTKAGVQISQNEFPVLYDLCTKVLATKLGEQPVFNNVLRTLDGKEIFFTHSLFNPEAIVLKSIN